MTNGRRVGIIFDLSARLIYVIVMQGILDILWLTRDKTFQLLK